MIKFRSDDRMDQGFSRIRSEKLPDRTDILQDDERRGNSLGDMKVKRNGVVDVSAKKLGGVREGNERTRTIQATRQVK